MYRYKTVVTDYEGMQEALATYGAQGWKLISASPDTWRIVINALGEEDSVRIVPGDLTISREISASYYLLVFEISDHLHRAATHEAAAEPLDYPDFSLPEY